MTHHTFIFNAETTSEHPGFPIARATGKGWLGMTAKRLEEFDQVRDRASRIISHLPYSMAGAVVRWRSLPQSHIGSVLDDPLNLPCSWRRELESISRQLGVWFYFDQRGGPDYQTSAALVTQLVASVEPSEDHPDQSWDLGRLSIWMNERFAESHVRAILSELPYRVGRIVEEGSISPCSEAAAMHSGICLELEIVRLRSNAPAQSACSSPAAGTQDYIFAG